jgi:hypothetical protein
MPPEKGEIRQTGTTRVRNIVASYTKRSILGRFCSLKSDANSVPAPAWSNDSTRVQKPLSVRDIQR